MDATLEILTTRRERRDINRQWPDQVKARIVSESLRPGVTATLTAIVNGHKQDRIDELLPWHYIRK